MAFRLWNFYTVPGVTPTVSNHHKTPPQTCGVVTEDYFPQYLYHPHSNFLKITNADSLLLLLVKLSDGLTFPLILLMEIGLEPFLSESMWERNLWYLTSINVLVGIIWGDEATTISPVLYSRTNF